jgi:hypothetical protein
VVGERFERADQFLRVLDDVILKDALLFFFHKP